MSSFVVIHFLLATTCATIAVILGVAWRSFGRADHARMWALSFVAAAIGWATSLVGLLVGNNPPGFEVAGASLLTLSAALLLAGFRRRAGRAPRTVLVWGSAALVIAVGVGGTVLGSALLVAAPPVAFTGIVLAASAATLLSGRRPTAAERTAAILIGLFAGFHFVAAAIAIAALPVHVGQSGALFWLLLMLGLPAGFVSNGFACLLLLASDLAERMTALAATDPLTHALNRRGLEQLVGPTIANSVRRGEPVALVAVDLDRFKAINDRHGHAIGDEVLRRFAEHVIAEIRAGDLFARLGGEEFAIVLPGTPRAVAAEVIDRVRRGLPTLCVEAIAPLALTASFGITEVAPGEDDLAGAHIRADRALYASKLAGRDRITIADDSACLAEAVPAA